MDAARTAPRPGPLLALALAATTAVSVLAPAAAGAGPTTGTDLVDVVVTSAAGTADAVADAVRAAGGHVSRVLPLVGGVSASLPAGAVLAPSYAVVPNAPVTLASRPVPDGREATAIRTALGLGAAADQGRGVRIAVVDTGVDDSPEFGARLTHLPVDGVPSGVDAYGHGTFVAGAAAGSGAASGGRYAGVAPGAQVLDVRVADDQGETDLATVLAGLQVAYDAHADVVNLSMASGSPLPYQIDPLTVALDRLWTAGTVVVVPTGNDGPSTGSVSSPGSDPTLLTVGALDERLTASPDDDVVTQFSGRGPAPQGVAKPDLVAPGQSLVSVRAPGSVVDLANPDASVGTTYFRGSGTSFATAVVSGAAAVLLSERGDLRPDQVKALVTRTAYTAKGLRDARDAGAGGLSLAGALAAATPTVPDAQVDAPPAGDVDTWHAFLEALLAGDRVAAANSWSQLSPEAHRWAASRWAALGPQASRWAANSWSASRWAGKDGSADEWQMRYWAASRWAASRWAASRWADVDLVASRWAANSWSASRWAGPDPASSRWADDEFAASRWSASRWSASRWSASRWSAALWG